MQIEKFQTELKDLEKKRNRLFLAVEEGILPLDESLTRMDFFHPVISKLCEAMGVASQGAIARSTTGWKKSCRRVACFMLKSRAHKQQVRHQEILTEIAGFRRVQQMPLKAIHSKHIERFSVAMRQRLLDRNCGLGKEYLKLLVDEITVEENQATITGSYASLANALTQTKKGPLERVPGFVPDWLPIQDSNE